ncbi:unnamed protein product [Caenorhabditis sp. 36 PRJEB53466]|nr:unnamed protein product [Caenorhabditis sp. 36 PRJEB53466]
MKIMFVSKFYLVSSKFRPGYFHSTRNYKSCTEKPMPPFEKNMRTLVDDPNSCSSASESMPDIVDRDRCAVCTDVVSSKRYGAPACLGCCVFFRRAVVNKLKYRCLRNHDCPITNEDRCSCRYCRLQKCYQVGMKASAIKIRDIVGPRKPINRDIQEAVITADDASVEMIQVLVKVQHFQLSQHKLAPKLEDDSCQEIYVQNRRRARASDVNGMLKVCVNQALVWGNQFRPFQRLSIDARRSVLAEYVFAFLLIDQGVKTAYEADDGFWLLQNDTFMHSDHFLGLPETEKAKENVWPKAQFHHDFVSALLNGISTPFRNLQIDEFECVALKTVLLLTQLISKNSDYSGHRRTVTGLLAKCMDELMEHSRRKFPERGAERFGEIVLLLSSIRCEIKTLYNQTRVSDLMEFDQSVRDMLLT